MELTFKTAFFFLLDFFHFGITIEFMAKSDLEAALKLLEKSFFKILKVNLTKDSYEILKSLDNELVEDKGFSPKISDWLINFGNSGMVYPADKDSYLQTVAIKHLREHFKNSEDNLRLRYRRKVNDGYCWSMMEMVKDSDYSHKNQTIVLFVQDVDKEQTHKFDAEQKILESMQAERISMVLLHDIVKIGSWSVTFDEKGLADKVDWSENFERNLGYDENESLLKTISSWKEILHPEDKKVVLFQLTNLIKGKVTGHLDITYRIRCKNGEYRWFRTAGEVIRRPDNSPAKFFGVSIDVNEHKEKEELIKKYENQVQLLHSLSESYQSVHVINLQKDSYVTVVSQPRIEQSAVGPDFAFASLKNVMKHVVTDEYQKVMQEFVDLTTLSERLKGRKQISVEAMSTAIGWFRATFIVNELDANGNVESVIFTTFNIDEEKRRESHLVEISTRDNLTGLLNRRAYDEKIDSIRDVKLPKSFCVINIDLNGLKKVNDTWGHQYGDIMLKGFADCLSGAVQDFGFCYRTGGDEFIVFAQASLKELKERHDLLVETMEKWECDKFKGLSASMGHATTAENPEASLSELIELSDKRMYQQKVEYYKNKKTNSDVVIE